MRQNATRYPIRDVSADENPKLTHRLHWESWPEAVIASLTLEKGEPGETSRWYLSLIYESGNMVSDDVANAILRQVFTLGREIEEMVAPSYLRLWVMRTPPVCEERRH